MLMSISPRQPHAAATTTTAAPKPNTAVASLRPPRKSFPTTGASYHRRTLTLRALALRPRERAVCKVRDRDAVGVEDRKVRSFPQEAIMQTRLFLGPVLVSTLAACSGPARVADTTTEFVGKWIYQSGSTILIDCPNTPEQSIDLSRVPPANQPAYFSLASSGVDTLHEIDARGCQYDWTVAGDVATAASGQSCATFPDGRGGNRVVQLQAGTKTTTDAASMVVDVHFASDAPEACSIHVRGQAAKSSL